MNVFKEKIVLGGTELSIECGKMARQANGAVAVRYGDAVVLVTAVASDEMRQGAGFLPLLVDYREQAYSAGKIPGGFFKREGRLTDKQILNARIVDRSIRPLFSPYFSYDLQVTVTLLSADRVNESDILGIIGASAALGISDIPFSTLIGAVRVGKIEEKFIINPTYEQLKKSPLDILVSATKDGVLMIEGAAKEIGEEEIVKAVDLAHSEIKKIIALQQGLIEKVGPLKKEFPLMEINKEIEKEMRENFLPEIKKFLLASSQKEKTALLKALWQKIKSGIPADEPEKEVQIKAIFENLQEETVRSLVLEKRRVDGRTPDQIRPIWCEAGILPCTHGSAIFSRGETQCLVVTTLGTESDRQRIDDIEEESSKGFMLHYNFPGFSTGEFRPERGPGRREVGHGLLAEKSLLPHIPSGEEFPYTIRVVSDILESNGSSSMATVCGTSLSLMDAGVPLKRPVAGVAMGLVREKGQEIILTDILGTEDHFGEMDFKIAGTTEGITALQLDVKGKELHAGLIAEILRQAKKAYCFILEEMAKAIDRPRSSISSYAPRIYVHHIPISRIKDLIGPGGKRIRSIIEETGVKIDVEDDGRVIIASSEEKKAKQALGMVEFFTAEVEVGRIYKGKVSRMMDFGAIVEILPGKEGLVHISQMEDGYTEDIHKLAKEGDEFDVKVISVDGGRVSLSRKQALKEEKSKEPDVS